MPAEDACDFAGYGNESMNLHPITFENLADWLDGRLDTQAQRAVDAHLQTGCPVCEADLAWLRRITSAARSDATVEPPREVVAKAKALYRVRGQRYTAQARRLPWAWSSRLSTALPAMLVLLVIAALLLLQLPAVFAREAILTAVHGSAEYRSAGADWQVAEEAVHLHQGDALRVTSGTAMLTLFDGSILQLQSGSELTLSSLRSGAFTYAVQIAVGQQSGSISYDVATLHGLLSAFYVHSPTARVSVRGTRFVVTVESGTESRVEVLEGRVEVANQVGSEILEQNEVVLVQNDVPFVPLPTLTPGPTPTKQPRIVPSNTALAPTSSSQSQEATTSQASTPQPAFTWQPAAATVIEPTATPVIMQTPEIAPTPVLTVTLVPNIVEFRGKIERLPANHVGLWLIGGRLVLVKRDTEIIGEPAVGRWVKVRALRHLVRPMEAVKIEVIRPPVQTPLPWATPQATATAVPTWGPRPTWTPEATVTPGTAWTPEATATPQPTATPRWTPLPRPTWTPRPTHTARPTRMPPVIVTPVPVATAQVEEVRFTGTIASFPDNLIGVWIIGRRIVLVTPNTQISGTPAVGLTAEVQGLRYVAATGIRAIRIAIR